MKNLKSIVEDINFTNELFGKKSPKIDIYRIDAVGARRIFEKIECDLSPENLCCDGEASPAYVRTRAKLLTSAKKELEALGFVSALC